jgi:hypothetical protein
MKEKNVDRLLLISFFFMAYWFFGNLYEEIVLIPNQLVNPVEALNCWQSYFSITDQVYYFVPCMLIAVIGTCILFFRSKERVQRFFLKRAMIFSMIAAGLTIVIVNEINERLFYGDIEKFKDQILMLVVLWLAGNAIRLYLVGTAMYHLFKAIVYRKSRQFNM